MKKGKNLLAVFLVLVMTLAMSFTAFAQEVTVSESGQGSITVTNAAKGETYKLYRLFEATVSESQTEGEADSIFYTGTIPEDLKAYFTTDENNNIVATAAAWKAGSTMAEMSDELLEALMTWANAEGNEPIATAVGDGSQLTFRGLKYGYYVVVSSQGTAISVDSTNPNAEIVDKNITTPKIEKSVNDDDVYIGQTVTYTLKATTANYLGEGEAAEIVTQYVIEDTLPAFLTEVKVTSITIGGSPYLVEGETPQFAEITGYTNKGIVIPWAKADENEKYVSLYANGAEIVVTYTAKVTDQAVVDGEGNKNTVTLTPYTIPNDGTTPDPWKDTYTAEEIIKTYAAALKKVDENDNALAGAKFAAVGLTVTGSKGNYIVTDYDVNSAELGTVMETDDEGQLVIRGLPSDAELSVTETEAPAGYNKLAAPIQVKPVIISETVTVTSTTTYYDENGNKSDTVTEKYTTEISYNEKLKTAAVEVENKKGLQLPSTGGVGTTLFYIIGGILVIGAGILLIVKRRMDAEK